MATEMQVHVNLPVANLDRPRESFESPGFTADECLSDATALAQKIDQGIDAMLPTHAKSSEFTPNPLADATKSSELLVCIPVGNRRDVDRYVRAAVKGGGTEFREPHDYGFMDGRSFADLDGHIWESVFMDSSQALEGFDPMEHTESSGKE